MAIIIFKLKYSVKENHFIKKINSILFKLKKIRNSKNFLKRVNTTKFCESFRLSIFFITKGNYLFS